MSKIITGSNATSGCFARSATSVSIVSPSLLLVALALLALMLLTRVSHFGSAVQLPSASTAVFFLGGFYLSGICLESSFFSGLRRRRLANKTEHPADESWRISLFWLFLFAAVGADVGSYIADRSNGHCLSPGYVAMLPAYWLLWQGGRWLAGSKTSGLRFVVYAALSWTVVGSASYLLRNGAFYWLSGRYPDPNMTEYLERLSQYFLPFVTAPLIYLVGAFALQAALGQRQRRVACA